MSFYFIQKITAPEGKFTCFEMKNGFVMDGIMGTVIVYDLMSGKQVVNFYFPLLNKECGSNNFLLMYFRLLNLPKPMDG